MALRQQAERTSRTSYGNSPVRDPITWIDPGGVREPPGAAPGHGRLRYGRMNAATSAACRRRRSALARFASSRSRAVSTSLRRRSRSPRPACGHVSTSSPQAPHGRCVRATFPMTVPCSITTDPRTGHRHTRAGRLGTTGTHAVAPPHSDPRATNRVRGRTRASGRWRARRPCPGPPGQALTVHGHPRPSQTHHRVPAGRRLDPPAQTTALGQPDLHG